MANTKLKPRSTDTVQVFGVDYGALPRATATCNKPTLREIFLLGWRHFVPEFPPQRRG